jgi:hypothetical protein
VVRSISEVAASARLTLNDDDVTRYKDPEVLGYVIDALNTIKNIRPDLFLGNYGALSTLTIASNLPINEQFFRPLTDYVIARCELKDDEHVLNARAELMAKMTTGYLT